MRRGEDVDDRVKEEEEIMCNKKRIRREGIGKGERKK
jgi:hypothetical protein